MTVLDFSADVPELPAPAVDAPAPPADPWLDRRRMTLGASEVWVAMLALGAREMTEAPRWMQERAASVRLPTGDIAPRLWAEKAGIVARKKPGRAALIGTERECEVLASWGGLGDLDDITHASSVPREWFPLVDRHCPALSCTPDAWGRDPIGRLVDVQVKTTIAPPSDHPRPWYEAQVQAEMAVTGASWGVLVTAWQWAAPWRPDGPIEAEVIERDDALIATIRSVAEETMARVRELWRTHGE